ncbi:SAGA-associated factor 11 homolog isoform X2 [Cylas formicarius]|uniref:SAGA-associated factor 11 homolog isoform X2 n=1 Tax=Cylas formicarius TaxID=197179 RepID=UPI00295842D0|nr:SAGA-associated factor 11 homolog isoform X2 [Cylas formicarius]
MLLVRDYGILLFIPERQRRTNLSFGIIFDEHRKYKTDAYDLEPDDNIEYENSIDTDILSQHKTKTKNRVVCICPRCDKRTAATKFASHLETCMGLGRKKTTSRRAASNIKDRGDTSYGGIHSDDNDDDDIDDEDDVDWKGTERKSKQKKRNGNKKNKGTPKKNQEHQQREHFNTDMDDIDEAYNNLRDLLSLHDHSNGSSPPGGSSSSGSKRSKANKKSKQKDRSSPRSYF